MNRFQVVILLSILLLCAGIVAAQDKTVIHANGATAFMQTYDDMAFSYVYISNIANSRDTYHLEFNFTTYGGEDFVSHQGSGDVVGNAFVAKAKSAHLHLPGFASQVCRYVEWGNYVCEAETIDFDLEWASDGQSVTDEIRNAKITQSGMTTHTTGRHIFTTALVNGTAAGMTFKNAYGQIGVQRDTEIVSTKTNRVAPTPTLEDMQLESQEVLSHFQRKAPSLKKADYTFMQIDYPGASLIRLAGINDAGVIAGSFALPDQPQQAFLLSKGVFTSISVPDAYSSQARGVNNAGQVVGVYRDINDWGLYGFLYSNGVFTKISHPTIAGDNYVQGIAADGTVVGHVVTEVDATSYVYKNGAYTSYSCGPGTYTQFQGIAANGTIVGNCDPDPATYLALFGTMGNFKQYQGPGVFAIGLTGVNANGIMVGTLLETDPSSTPRGFVFDGKNLALLDYPGATQTTTRGINAAGQIVGTFDNGAHGFIAAPRAAGKLF